MRKLFSVLVAAVALAFGGLTYAQAPSCPATGPVLVYPADNSTSVPRGAGSTVTVKWNPVANTANYDIYFGPLGDGCSGSPHATVPSNTTQWSAPSAEIIDGATYEWKVVAKGPIGCSIPKPSNCARFTMRICPTTAPTLTEPANNASVNAGDVKLKWTAVANAAFYEIYNSVDNGPVSLVATTTATEKFVTVEPGRSVQWAVKAAATGCNGALSQPFKFTTKCPTAGATLSTPTHGATFKDDTSILFSWSAVEGAAGYGVYRSLDGGQTWTLLVDNLTGRNYTTKFAVGNWMWKVRAHFAGNCPDVDSAPSAFSVTSASCGNSPATLVAPADGAAQSLPITFAWTPPSGGKRFLIFVSGPNGTSQVGDTTGNSFVLSSLTPGTYQWYVVTKFDNCPDLESARRTLIVNKRECPQGSISTTSPVNNATVTSPVTFAWTSIPDAKLYRIWASLNGSAPVLIGSTTSLSTSVALPAGAFKWRVEGVREDCLPIFSPESNFTILQGANCSNNVAPQLLPVVIKDDDDPAAGKPVLLPWIAQTRGALFRVWISKLGAAFEDVGITRENQFEINLPPGAYRWYVEEYIENCLPLRSAATEEFLVEDTTPRCLTDKPVLAEPVNGATYTKLRFRVVEVTVVNRPVRYRFFAIVDRTNALPEIVFLGASTKPEFEPDVQLPPATYQVFVERSVDECPSTFSDRITVTIGRAQNCPTAVPQLLLPANNSTNNSPKVKFVWGGTFPEGTKFVVIAAVNAGAPTPIGTTTEMNLERVVPPGRLRWRVAAFPPGCNPLFSVENIAGIALPQGCSLRAPVALDPPDESQLPEGEINFEWSNVPNAKEYNLFVWKQGDVPTVVATTNATKSLVSLTGEGTYLWFVDVEGSDSACPANGSGIGEFAIVAKEPCGVPDKTEAYVIGKVQSGVPYTVRWTPLANVKTYEVQKSATSDFANPETMLVTGLSVGASQSITVGAAQTFWRVRGIADCNDAHGPFSNVVTNVVQAPKTNNASAEVGTVNEIVQQIVLPPSSPPRSFTIATDRASVKASPSSGVVGDQPVTITLTSDPRGLALGTNTATVKVSYADLTSSTVQSHAFTVVSIPVNVSLVTPVTPGGKSGPPPDALIFSGVGHAAGQNNSFFESDVRLVNLGAQTQKYQINYTPSGTDGTLNGSTTTIEIAPNQSLALDDVVSSVFGLGDLSGALGMLEARPLTSASSSSGFFSSVTQTAQQLLTIGSSRTYNVTENGTFGQFVPATPFAKFVGSGKVLSLLHVAQSASMRANFGFLEASGNPVDLTVRVYNILGQLVGTIPVSLQASEHKQIGLMLVANGITDLEDGRVEVEVVNGSGKITAYVSELDNATNDPFLVSAVEKGSVNTNRYVVPGMAHKDLGFAFWVSDVRIHNAGTASVPATLTFYSEGNPSSFVSKQVTIDPGEIEVLNDIVQNFFTQPNGAGGSLVVTTPSNVPLGITARTYNRTDAGTYGQYLPAVTVAESVGLGDRSLNILQVEQSSRMRTNIALTETSGSPATVEVGLVIPDSLATPTVTFNLAGNEFRQFSVGDFQIPDAIYNGRITVKVIGGTGKVTTHGSLIDMATNDGTLIPPQ